MNYKMSFTEALQFPFSNLAKLLTIVLGLAVLIALLAMVAFVTGSIGAVFGIGLVVILAQSLFLSGYGVRIIRNIINEQRVLPPIQIADDIGRGFIMFMGGLLYILPVVGFLFVLGLIAAFFGQMALIIGLLLMIPVSFRFGMAFLVGMARYAIEDKSSVVFEMGYNLRFERENRGLAIILFGWQILIALLYAFINQVVTFAYEGAFLQADLSSETTLLVILIVGYILSMTISLLSQVSSLYLVAQFAQESNLTNEKAKRDKPKNDFGSLSSFQ